MSRHTETIMGHKLPEPRPTSLGVWLAVFYLGLPTLFLLLLFDVLVWAVFEILFDRCVALWCLI